MSGTSRAATAALLSAFAALALTSSPAAAEEIPSALGIACSPGPDGVQRCEGSIDTRVPSWEGVPLDVNLAFPPAARRGPHPLIVYLHGWGGNKDQVGVDVDELAEQGYAVMAYSARGFGDSCGSEVSRTASGCARGWIHLADARFEARDTQHLAGLLVDEGLVEPGIGVTGDSYGGGQSLILATLKDRVMRPDGKLVPWRSPGGTPMRIAAAAPRIGWSDLSYSLVPNGGTLDFRSRNPYRIPVGVVKDSYLDTLFLLGGTSGFYAPPGEDPDANIPEQFDLIQAGEPYDSNPALRRLLARTNRFHSAYYLEQGVPRRERARPAPFLIYNAWTDDLFPADEAIRYAKLVRVRHPGQVSFTTREAKTLTSEGGDQATADAVNPIAGAGSCRTVNAGDDPGAATYRLPAAAGAGYTLMGSPTVIAHLTTSGEFPQIAARLWDLAPDGSQTLVTRAIYRPTEKRTQVFQLHPNGWRFEAGHVPKLELLGRDAPYARPSNGPGFRVDVSRLRLELPVRERPGGAIGRYSPPK